MKHIKNISKYISLLLSILFFVSSTNIIHLNFFQTALAGSKEDFQAKFKDYGENGNNDFDGMMKSYKKNGKQTGKEDSIINVMYYLLSPGSYMNDVSKGTYGDDKVDKETITESDGKKTVCGNTQEPQNLLNHNCNIPSFATELFQNVFSTADKQGVEGAGRTSSVAWWGFGKTALDGNVPITYAKNSTKYTALEIFGYDLEPTTYLGEWDNIQVSTEARLLANYGFLGKAKLGAVSILNGIGAGLNAAVSQFSWNPLEYIGNIWNAAVGSSLWTIVDTSDMNVVTTHSWKRPTFSKTLYNAYYMTDKEVTEKGQAEFVKTFYELLKGQVADYPELQELFALKLDDENFPQYNYDGTKEKSKLANGEVVYETDKEQFAKWKETTAKNIIDRGKSVGIDCSDKDNYVEWQQCWATKWDEYTVNLITDTTSSSSDGLTDKAKTWAKNQQITFIGDSLMVGVSQHLLGYAESNNFNINAKESRMLYNPNGEVQLDAYRIMQQMKNNGEIKENVVIALGTNNGFTEEQLTKFIDELPGHVKNVVLVTTRSDVSVRSKVSEIMKSVASKNDKVKVLDWNASADSWGWASIVSPDKVHMKNYAPYGEYLIQGLYDTIGTGSPSSAGVSEKYAAIFNDISEKIQKQLLEENKFINPSISLSHYICADSEGKPTGSSMADWTYVYTDNNTKTSENLNPSCKPVRPSIEGALLGTGDNKSTDTRYAIFKQREQGVKGTSIGFFGGLGKWFASVTTKITNTLLTFSFSNLMETLGITELLKTTIISFRDGLFFPLVVLIISITSLFTLLSVFRQGNNVEILKTLAKLCMIYMLGVFVMFMPDTIIKLTEEIPNNIDNYIANIILHTDEDSTDILCSASTGNKTGVRSMQCKMWEMTIFRPYTEAQWGTNWTNLDKSDFSNSNSDLVGNATFDFGNGKSIENWALYQLSLVKTGTLTDSDDSYPVGSVSKSIYKLVDLQAGPNNAAKSDGKYLLNWSGISGDRNGTYFQSGIIGFSSMLVVGGLAVAKIEMTIMFTIYLFILPIMFLVGLLPRQQTKLKDYGSLLLDFYVKRIAIVFLLSLILKIITLVGNSDVNYSTLTIFFIAFLWGAKLYYKEFVNLFALSTGSFSNAAGRQIGQLRENIKNNNFMPPFIQRRFNMSTQGTKEMVAGGAAGAIVGALNKRREKKAGFTRKDNVQKDKNVSGVWNGMKQGASMGLQRGQRMESNKARRQGFGLVDNTMQAYRASVDNEQKVATDKNHPLHHDLNNMKAIVKNRKTEIAFAIKVAQQEFENATNDVLQESHYAQEDLEKAYKDNKLTDSKLVALMDKKQEKEDNLKNLLEEQKKVESVDKTLTELSPTSKPVVTAKVNKALRTYRPGDSVYKDGKFEQVSEKEAVNIFIDRVYNATEYQKERSDNNPINKVKEQLKNNVVVDKINDVQDVINQVKDNTLSDEYKNPLQTKEEFYKSQTTTSLLDDIDLDDTRKENMNAVLESLDKVLGVDKQTYEDWENKQIYQKQSKKRTVNSVIEGLNKPIRRKDDKKDE